MKRSAMIFLQLYSILLTWIILIHIDKDSSSVEYELEIINQDSALIRSVETDGVYYAHPDSIVDVLEKDNL